MAFDYPLYIDQGIAFTKTFTRKTYSIPEDKTSPLVPVDMTGMEAKGVIRTRDGELIATLICTVNGAAGQVVIGLPHTTTAAFDFGTAIADVDLWAGGVPVRRFMRSTVTLCKDVLDE